ncbi:MAG: response regulator [Candidatus Omnitrophota bacterium]
MKDNFEEEHFRKFNIAFALMSIVPFLVFLYLLATQLFSIDIVIGNIGLVLIASFSIALLGYYRGYSIIKSILCRLTKQTLELKSAYTELKETQDRLIMAEKFKGIGQLASGIAHEIKNPLGILLQDITYLEDNVTLQKDTADILCMMKRNVEKADSVVRTLMDFSRVTALDIKAHDAASIIENCLVLMQHKVELKHIKIIKELGDSLPKVLVDSVKLEQVLVNLFLNAVQAMPDSGTLTIRASKKELDEPGKGIGGRREDFFRVGETAVIIEIEDTGTGIPKEKLSRVFEPFFSLKGAGRGTGLGLSVSKNIIDMHKGFISVESQEAKGTKISIALKVDESSIVEEKQQAEVEAKPGSQMVNKEEVLKKKRVMVIDDEQDFLQITKLNLQNTGRYEILTLSSAKDIISQVRDFKPDLILLDILMPDIGGIEACEMLNQDASGREIPIIIISALKNDADKLKAYKVGVIDYLEKPIRRDTLISRIEKALEFK